MTSETFYRIWWTILLVAFLLLVGRTLLFGQQVEGAMGSYPLPKIVGMSGQDKKPPPPISMEILPKIAQINPYKTQTFRVRFRIEEHPDNREYAYSATCGSEIKSTIREVDAVSYTRFEELTVVASCVFQVCVSRVGKKYPICIQQGVTVPELPP